MIKKYRKKPVTIEAVQWAGDNVTEIASFTKSAKFAQDVIYIETLEGTMQANINDYIIKGVKGEFYPCKPDIFEQTYEEVE